MKQIHIRLSDSMHKALRIQAAINGQTIQDYVEQAIKEKIENDKKRLSTEVYTNEKPAH